MSFRGIEKLDPLVNRLKTGNYARSDQEIARKPRDLDNPDSAKVDSPSGHHAKELVFRAGRYRDLEEGSYKILIQFCLHY